MGKPPAGNAAGPRIEFIGAGGDTERSETSQYLEEQKKTFISTSSGERTGNSLNLICVIARMRCR